MKHRRGITCEISAFHIDEPPYDGVTGPHEWMAIATAHVYNPNPDTGGILTPTDAILAGAVMEVLYGRATAATEGDAMSAALDALLFNVAAKGFANGSP